MKRPSLDGVYAGLSRLHDLWVLLAWAGILAGIMLNTFYHRNCFAYVAEMDLTAPCQGFTDLGLILLAAVGAGMAMNDEAIAFLGFIVVHAVASVFFVLSLTAPSLLGLTDPALTDAIFGRSIVLSFRYQFPFAILCSIIGVPLGLFLSSKVGS